MKLKQIFPILIILIAIALYFPTLNDQFLSDDYDHLMFAETAKNIRMIPGLFKIPGDMYRPIMNLSIASDYLIYHYYSIGFHLTNIIFFILTSLLIYAIVRKISKNSLLAFFSALIFTIIPNHHETVTWIGGRTDLLACFFYLLTIFCFIKFILEYKPRHPEQQRRIPWFKNGILRFTQNDGYLWLVLSYLTAIPAFFSKEISMTLPFTIAIIYLVYLKKNSNIRISQYPNIRKVFLLWLPYIVLLILYLIIRKQIVGSWIGGYRLFGEVSSTSFSPKSILLPFYFVKYLFNFDYLAAFIPKFATNFYANILAIFEIISFLIIALFLNLKRLKDLKFWKNIIFLVFITFFVSIPNFSILPALKLNLMNTRVLFIASIPIAILISYLIFNNQGKKASTLPMPARQSINEGGAGVSRKFRIAFASLICLIFSLGFFFNYMPWHKAQAKAKIILNSIQELHPEFSKISYATYDKELFFKNLPDNIYGAFVFRNGFPEALRIKFKNKKIFVNPKEKIVWVVKNNKDAITSLCNYKKNPQTNEIQVFDWNDKLNTFIEQQDIAEKQKNKKTRKQENTQQIQEFNQELNNLSIEQVSNGKSFALKSPTLNFSPQIIDEINLKMTAEQNSIADFLWINKECQKFNDLNNNILIPIKAGDNEYKIDLTKCPAWFTSNEISQFELIPTEKKQKIKIENIQIK